MDELLLTALNTYFSQERLDEIYRSFGLFGLFNHAKPFEDLDNVVNDTEQYGSDQIVDSINAAVAQGLDYLLDHHGINLVEEATLEEMNEIVSGLYALQYLDNYEPVARILENTMDGVEKMACILEQVCSYDSSRILGLIKDYRDTTLVYLRKFINEKELCMEQAQEENSGIRMNLAVLHSMGLLGQFQQDVLASGLILGVAFKSYIPLFEEEFVDVRDITGSASRVLFMIVVSSDGSLEPLKVFTDNVSLLCKDPAYVGLLSAQFKILLGKFTETKAAMQQL